MATKAKKPVKAKPAPAKDACEAFGMDRVCKEIVGGSSLTTIAKMISVSIGTFLAWIDGDVERSARAREARASTARLWDERATDEIDGAGDPFELSKAKELAHHYRWRASKIAPKEYGDKLQQDITITDTTPMSDRMKLARERAKGKV